MSCFMFVLAETPASPGLQKLRVGKDYVGIYKNGHNNETERLKNYYNLLKMISKTDNIEDSVTAYRFENSGP